MFAMFIGLVGSSAWADWLQAGNAGNVQGANADTPTITVFNGTPYLETVSGGGVYVQQWNGNNWQQVGSQVTTNAFHACLAFSNTGTPYVCAMTLNLNTNLWQIQVHAWNGASWLPIGSFLNVNSNQSASICYLAVASNGTPYVCWLENDPSSTGQNNIYVKHWDGATWIQDGTRLNTNLMPTGYSACIALDRNIPYVGWVEDDGQGPQVYVEHWNGSIWVRDGGALTSIGGGGPSLAFSGDTLYAAFVDNGLPYVKKWNGSNWVLVGGSIDSSGAPFLTVSNGTPYVIYSREENTNYKIIVQYWTGSTWKCLGGTLNDPVSGGGNFPEMTFCNGVPWASWVEFSCVPNQPVVKYWSSLTATPTPGIIDPNPLIDDFSDGTFQADAGQRDADWEASGGLSTTITLGIGSSLGVNNTPYLTVAYNKTSASDWSFFAANELSLPGKRTDFSTDHRLSMAVHGSVQLLVKFEDINGNQSGNAGTIKVNSPNQWVVATLDYSGVAWNQCDSQHIQRLIFFPSPGAVGQGSFSMDNVTLGAGSLPPIVPTPTTTPTVSRTPTITRTPTISATSTKSPTVTLTPTITVTATCSPTRTVTSTLTATATFTPDTNPLIDNFDNDGNYIDTAGQRNAQWWVSTSTVYNLAISSGVAGDTTPLLVVNYNKPSGQEWSFIAAGNLTGAGNHCDFTTDHLLSMNLLGNIQLLVKFQDINGNESANVGTITMNSPNQWVHATLDYSGVDWQQCDPHHIQQIFFFPAPGQTGAGQFCLDDLYLGVGVPAPLPPTPTPTITPTATPGPTMVVNGNWVLLGAGAVNDGMNGGAGAAKLGVSNGVPRVTWTGSSLDGSGWQMYEKHWEGSAWIQDGALGSGGSGGGFAVANGVPHLAWNYEPSASTIQLIEKYWNGSAWVQDGGNIEVVPGQAFGGPDLAMANSIPYVTWTEFSQGAPRTVYVKHWNGSTWVQDGGNLQVNSTYDTGGAKIAISNGAPSVAWIEFNPATKNQYGYTQSQVYVKQWVGSTWTQVGGALNANQSLVPNISLACFQGTPYVALSEGVGSHYQVSIRHWDGSTWVQDGGILNVDPGQDALEPSLAFAGATPYVAWSEGAEIYVKHWDGSTWVQDGGSLNVATNLAEAFYPSLVIDNGNIYVAWQELQTLIYVKQFVPGTVTGASVRTANAAGASVGTATPTGTSNRDLAAVGITAYPNPAKDHVTFVWESTGLETVRIEIYNLAGQRVAEVRARSGNMAVWSTNNVANGIYFYQVILTNNGQDEKQSVKRIAIVK
jgi:hypothetical protein